MSKDFLIVGRYCGETFISLILNPHDHTLQLHEQTADATRTLRHVSFTLDADARRRLIEWLNDRQEVRLMPASGLARPGSPDRPGELGPARSRS